MGLFSRWRKEERTAVQARPTEPSPSDALSEPPRPRPEDGRPVSAPLTDAERSRISRGLEELAARGVDIDDLAAIGAAYDRAHADAAAGRGDAAEVVELFGVAIGEHLVRRSTRGWSVVTDAFGTDLGLVDARADTVVVPHNLVSARWMRGETGWIPGVVQHLVGLCPRAGA
ncbi:DUF3806 domain-containing protein [Intrasporangium sp.]|uniref:DUF3806 domain-containing protein n=1 Tax=Intrasporangium sp. TaxID=1925024 RepID=UPI0029398E5D|nr:DUF3806 domain-containing protein [Intrasporangium sp.]MDV3223132.1 DUF3806 domain-containing protein [Intrasporangium sp.]